MPVVLIAVVLVAAVVAVVVLRGRPRSADHDSVRSYHSALGTLEHLSERNVSSTVRVVEPGEQGAPRRVNPTQAGARTEVPPVPVRGNAGFPDPGSPLVFDDARPRDRTRGEGHDVGGPPRADRAHRHALDSMNHRPRRATTVAVAAVVIVLFAGLVYAGSKRSNGSHHSATATTSAGHGSSGHGTSGPAHGSSSTTAPHGGTTTTTKPPRPTPTTLPTSLIAGASTTTSATYTVPYAAYQLSVTSSVASWVQATTVATGRTLFAAVVAPGAPQVISAVGAVTVEIGVPSVTMVVGKIPVVLPTPMHTPFVATFQPAAQATGAGTTVPSTASSTGG